MDIQNLIAIDTLTHLEVSCWNPFDNYDEEHDRAADKFGCGCKTRTRCCSKTWRSISPTVPEVHPLILKDNAVRLLGLQSQPAVTT